MIGAPDWKIKMIQLSTFLLSMEMSYLPQPLMGGDLGTCIDHYFETMKEIV